MAAASKLLANMVYNYKGMGLSMVSVSQLAISYWSCKLVILIIDVLDASLDFFLSLNMVQFHNCIIF